jgi:FeS assembly protein IscX
MSLLDPETTRLPDEQEDGSTLTWEDSFAIAQALRAAHTGISLEEVSLGMIYRWTVALPSFVDDPELANEAILNAIYLEWFEEVNPV